MGRIWGQSACFPAEAGIGKAVRMYDLLTEPLIRTRLVDGTTEALSLPSVYAALAEDRVASFLALRPHQRHAWHAFLAQLATIALHRAGAGEPATTARRWCVLLRGLIPAWKADEPWHLVVEDTTQPAFMQCPVPHGLGRHRGRKETPDDLDLLVTSKNHDVKQRVAVRGEPQDWTFALINLQTMAGFLGKGNYGIARMNGGYSSRPCLGLAPEKGGPGAHVFFDVSRMLEERNTVLGDHERLYRRRGGMALLWTKPWDGKSSLDMRDMDPYFIEVCRQVRLVRENGQVIARTATSQVSRVNAKTLRGNVGDFWTPVKDGKALSLSRVGFRYDRLVDLILPVGSFKSPPAMKVPAGGSCNWRLVARGIAGGQGKTDGYHERVDVVFRRSVAGALFKKDKGAKLAETANDLLKEIAGVGKALRFGIAVAASGGKSPDALSKSDRSHAHPYARRLDAVADARFFGVLQDRFLATKTEGPVLRARFVRNLIWDAERLLGKAIESVSCSAIRRHRARTRAEDSFWGRLRREFGELDEILETPRRGTNVT